MNKVPKFAPLNFDKIEKVCGLKLRDHHRQDLWKEGQSLQAKIRFFTTRNQYLSERQNKAQASLRRVREAVEFLDGNYLPDLKLYKKNLTDIVETEPMLVRRGPGQPKLWSFETICNMFYIYKDAGGKGIVAGWNDYEDKNQGKCLDFICEIFGQLKIEYSRNTVTNQIKAMGKYFRTVQKATDGVSDHKLKNPAKRARFRDFVDAFRLLGLSRIEEKKKPIPQNRAIRLVNP